MKRSSLSLAITLSLAAASGACAVQSGDPAPTEGASAAETSPVAKLGPSKLHTEGSTTTAVCLAAAVASADPAVGLACGIGTDLLSLLGGANGIGGLLGGGADQSAALIAQLSAIDNALVQIGTDIKALYTAMEVVNAGVDNTSELNTAQNVGKALSNAQVAASQLIEWVQTGKTNAALINDADNTSNLGAQGLAQVNLYYRVNPKGGADIFDLRPALLAYLYALTVRLAVIGAEDPNFRCANDVGGFGCVLPYKTELTGHINFLNSLEGLNQPSIGKWHETQQAGSTYALCSYAEDLNSGTYSWDDEGSQRPNGTPAGCIVEDSVPYGTITPALAATGLSYLEFWDNWNIEEEMGVHAGQKMAALLATMNTPDFPPLLRVCLNGACPTPYNPVGPLVTSTGACLTGGSGASPSRRAATAASTRRG